MIVRAIAYLLLIGFFVSCKKDQLFDCFKMNGKTVTEIRYPGEFNVVKVFDKIDLTVSSGQEYKIEVSADDNIIKKITTVIKGDVLFINNNNSCGFVRGYKKNIVVKITVPRLTDVENWGVGTTKIAMGFSPDAIKLIAESSGDIYFYGEVHRLAAYSNGSADIYLNGVCDSLKIYMAGTNYLYAKDFTIKQYARLETQSLGDCFINATSLHQLDYAIYNDGNIYCKGLPRAIRNINQQNAKGQFLSEN